MKQKVIEMEPHSKFLFMMMMNAALKMHNMGLSEAQFLDFAKGIWETIEMNDKQYLEDVMRDAMTSEVSEFVAEIRKQS